MTEVEEHAALAVARARELAGDEQRASLMGLLALSMVMIRSGQETHILHLATTAVSSLGDCHTEALLIDGVWQRFGSVSEEPSRRHDLQRQVAALPPDGGAIDLPDVGLELGLLAAQPGRRVGLPDCRWGYRAG